MDIQAVRLFLEEADKMAPLDQCLEEAGFSKRSRKLVSRLRSSVRCAERSLTVAARIRAARVSKRVLAKRTYSDGLDTSDVVGAGMSRMMPRASKARLFTTVKCSESRARL